MLESLQCHHHCNVVLKMIHNVNHVANWEHIRQRKQTLVDKNNDRENKSRIPHSHKTGNKVVSKRGTENECEPPNEGPHSILKTHDNRTMRLQKGAITDTVNIRCLMPFHEQSKSSHGGECNRQDVQVRRSARFNVKNWTSSQEELELNSGCWSLFHVCRFFVIQRSNPIELMFGDETSDKSFVDIQIASPKVCK